MIKTYEALFDSKNKGVYSISIVEDPAMEGNFVALSKEKKIEFQTVDEEQRILIGLVLEPNKPIYRNQGGEEFNIVFSENTIKDLSHNFFKQGYQNNSSIEHADKVKGVSFVESWIVEDSAIDKSANYGFSYPKGSWIATMKVDDENVWQDYVKTGKVKGFSIDAFLTLKEIKLNINSKKMTEEKSKVDALTDALLSFFKTNKVEEEVKLEEVMPEEVAPEEAPQEEVAPEEEKSDCSKALEMIEEFMANFKKENDSKIEEMKAEFSKENEVLKSELVELKSQPASKPVNAVVEQVELNKKGKLLQKLRQNK